jgi:hypothetical protein
MTVPEPTVRTTRYEVSCLPEGGRNSRAFTITAEHRGRGQWVVTDGVYPMRADGSWDYEFLKGDRFDLDTALALAKEHAPLMTVNGWTVQDALDKAAETASKEN